MSRQLRPSPSCLNCAAAVTTRFCPECGQENTDYRVSLGRLLGDLVEELFQLESRLWRTLWLLFRRPGLLTREYSAGRRVRYTTPLRLYLVASVVYFFVAGLHQSKANSVKVDAGSAAELQQEIAKTKPGLKRELLERLAVAQKDPKSFAERAQQAVYEWVPRMMALLVPLYGLLTFVFFRRCKRFYVEHLVFALHLHAVAFLLFTVGEVGRNYFGGGMAFLAVMVWTFVAARRVFEESWARVAWKLPLVCLLYGLFLSLGIAAAFVIGGSILVV
jgi:hypothetical protein